MELCVMKLIENSNVLNPNVAHLSNVFKKISLDFSYINLNWDVHKISTFVRIELMKYSLNLSKPIWIVMIDIINKKKFWSQNGKKNCRNKNLE